MVGGRGGGRRGGRQPSKDKQIVPHSNPPKKTLKRASTSSHRAKMVEDRPKKTPAKKMRKPQDETSEESEDETSDQSEHEMSGELEVVKHVGEGASKRGSGKKKRTKTKSGNCRKTKSRKCEIEEGLPIPGGPVNETILKNFRKHIAFDIWSGEKEDRIAMKPHYHITKLKEWDVSKEEKRVQEKLKATGLMDIVYGAQKNVDRSLISAIVERWHSETNTFHLPFGEMTITLDDVHHILGVPVAGRAVVGEGRTMSIRKLDELQQQTLGCVISLNSKNCVLNSLREYFSNRCDENSDERVIDYAVRAYLLYMFGCIPFAEKTTNTVSAHLLLCLKNVDEIKDYNWGAAILAWLYHHLGLASASGCTQIGGCLNLLQVWVIEHLMVRRFVQAKEYVESQPIIYKWTTEGVGGGNDVIKTIREDLDDINQSQVCWDPYKNHRDSHSLQEVTFFKGYLVFYNVVEPYNPDRVLRQFGRTQIIPPNPTRYASLDSNLYSDLARNLTQWQDHCLNIDLKGNESKNDWSTVPEYMKWFMDISHVTVQNPERRITPREKVDNDNMSDVEGLSLSECHSKMLELCDQYSTPKGMIRLVNEAQRKAEALYRQLEIKAKNGNERMHSSGNSSEGDSEGDSEGGSEESEDS